MKSLCFKLPDWENDYYTPKMYEAEDWIETYEREVVPGPGQFTSFQVLQDARTVLHNKVAEKTNEAKTGYGAGETGPAESRALSYQIPFYQALRESIAP